MLRPPGARAPAAQLPEPGARGGGAGSRRDPAPPLRAPEAAGPRVPARGRPGFIPARSGSGARRGDASRPCAPSLRREPARRLRAGAGWAQGAGHAAREGTTAQPIGAAPPPPAFLLRLFPAPGAGVPGSGRAHPLPPIASVCPLQNRRVLGCWEVRGTCPVREGKVAPLKTPLSRGRSGLLSPLTSWVFPWGRAKRAPRALKAAGFKGLQNKH